MGDGDHAGSHELDNVDAKVLIDHGVETYFGSPKPLVLEFRPRHVYSHLDAVREAQALNLGLHSGNALLVPRVATAAYDDKFCLA